jgi:alpha-amylase
MPVEEFTVIWKLIDQVHELVPYYFIDGLRVDTAKHIHKNFWPQVSMAAFASTFSGMLINDTHYAAQIRGE